MTKPWQDPDVLRRLYVDEGMSTIEIGEKFDVTDSTIGNWMEKHGIERPEKPYKDKETLRQLYHDERMTTYGIAEKFGVVNSTITYWMKKHGIEARSISEVRRDDYVPLRMSSDGYEQWCDQSNDERKRVAVHQLLAIAEGENPHDVFSDENVIHHKNGLQWDNRASNVELMSISKHISHHNEEQHGGSPWRDEVTLRELYIDNGMSTTEIGNELDCSDVTIGNWLNKHGIERPEKPWKDRGTLRRLYIDDGKSTYDIAEELDCSDVTVSEWLRRYDIPVRGRWGEKQEDSQASLRNW